MSDVKLGLVSQYSNQVVGAAVATFNNKDSNFHAIMTNSAKTLHALVLLVENVILFLKEKTSDALNSKAATKFKEKILIPMKNNAIFLKDRIVEQTTVLYHKVFK